MSAGPLPGARTTPLTSYLIRRSTMQLVLAEDLARSLVRERQQEAAADGRAARLLLARRWERRAAAAGRRARAARAAVR